MGDERRDDPFEDKGLKFIVEKVLRERLKGSTLQ